MKCPYCEYIDGWDSKTMESVDGPEGDFYRLPIKLERRNGWDNEDAGMYACPKCKKTFICELS